MTKTLVMTNSFVYFIPGIIRENNYDYNLIVSKIFNIEYEDMIKKTRNRDIVVPRQVAMTLYRIHTNLSFDRIGKMYGLDHATVIHAVKTIKDLLQYDKQFRKQISPIESLLKFN